MFIGRERELESLEKVYAKAGFSLICSQLFSGGEKHE